MTWPDAEISIDAALVNHLLHSQHPAVAGEEVTEVASGFDNSIWRLGTDLALRLPRRAAAAVCISNEIKWLPEVATRLPLLTPIPVEVGRPDEFYPWPWSISKWINGVPGNFMRFDERGTSAEILGAFLRALHRPAPPDAPFNEFRSVQLEHHAPSYLQRITALGETIDAPGVLAVVRRAIEAPQWSSGPLWIHGDLHPANTIYRDTSLVGVIDFGDMCAGDPATDLAGAFLSLPLQSVPVFFDAYGDVDEATVTRALGWAAHFGLMFTMLGARDETYGPIGARALENVVHYSPVDPTTPDA